MPDPCIVHRTSPADHPPVMHQSKIFAFLSEKSLLKLHQIFRAGSPAPNLIPPPHYLSPLPSRSAQTLPRPRPTVQGTPNPSRKSLEQSAGQRHIFAAEAGGLRATHASALLQCRKSCRRQDQAAPLPPCEAAPSSRLARDHKDNGRGDLTSARAFCESVLLLRSMRTDGAAPVLPVLFVTVIPESYSVEKFMNPTFRYIFLQADQGQRGLLETPDDIVGD